MKQIARIVLVLLFALQLSCSSFTDPAVRLANGIEKALKEHKHDSGPIRLSCDLGVPRGYVVVLHPDGELTNEQLVAAGLSPAQVDVLRGLRLGSHEAIYVLSSDAGTPHSRTTYQRNFVRIPRVMVATKSSSSPLQVNLAGAPEDRIIESIQ